MPLVARDFDTAAKVEPLLKERERPPLRLLIRVVLPHRRLELLDEITCADVADGDANPISGSAGSAHVPEAGADEEDCAVVPL